MIRRILKYTQSISGNYLIGYDTEYWAYLPSPADMILSELIFNERGFN